MQNLSGLFATAVDDVKLTATLVGSIIGLLSIVRHFRKQVLRRNRQKVGVANQQRFVIGRSFLMTNFLIKQEVVIIISCGIFLNVIGLMVSSEFSSILFLDMLGTAVVALLLGPYYAAAAGLMSNLVNSMLIGGPSLIPWGVVNMVGGLMWGYLARTAPLMRFMTGSNAKIRDQVSILLLFGPLSAAVMAMPAPFIQLAIGQTSLAIDPDYPIALGHFISQFVPFLKSAIAVFLPEATGEAIANYFFVWIERSIIFLPDKVFSIVGAIVLVKAAFPLFEKFLIHPDVYNKNQSHPEYFAKILLLVALLVYYVGLILVIFAFKSYQQYSWVLLALPAVALIIAVLADLGKRPTADARLIDKNRRKQCYDLAVKLLPEDTATRPGPTFWLGYLALSFGLIALIPLYGTDNYVGISFNLLCVICGFQGVAYLYGVAMCQNLVVRAIESGMFVFGGAALGGPQIQIGEMSASAASIGMQ